MNKVFFTKIREEIMCELLNSKESVKIAMAYLTDIKIIELLCLLSSKGINVSIIISSEEINFRQIGMEVQKMINQGVKLYLYTTEDDRHSILHHKFCIIDHKTLLQGSFNWTKKANESNNETLLLIKDDNQSINEFTEEFERLKKLAGLETERHQLEIAKALNYFTLIKTFINIGKTNEINAYLHEIKNIEELKTAVDLLFNGEYEKGFN